MICVDAPGIQLQFSAVLRKRMRRLAPVMPDIRCRGVCLTMNNSQIADTPVTVNAPGRQVIPVKGPVHRWIEPWYLAYAILGALASGLAVILIPLVVTNSGGSSVRFGYESVNLFAAAGALLSLPCVLPLRNRGVKP